MVFRSYLSSLSVPVRFGEKNIDSDMFGSRSDFLDRLPPFDDASAAGATAKEFMQDVDSPDFWCQGRNKMTSLS